MTQNEKKLMRKKKLSITRSHEFSIDHEGVDDETMFDDGFVSGLMGVSLLLDDLKDKTEFISHQGTLK